MAVENDKAQRHGTWAHVCRFWYTDWPNRCSSQTGNSFWCVKQFEKTEHLIRGERMPFHKWLLPISHVPITILPVAS